jgi:hypothetical protein
MLLVLPVLWVVKVAAAVGVVMDACDAAAMGK